MRLSVTWRIFFSGLWYRINMKKTRLARGRRGNWKQNNMVQRLACSGVYCKSKTTHKQQTGAWYAQAIMRRHIVLHDYLEMKLSFVRINTLKTMCLCILKRVHLFCMLYITHIINIHTHTHTYKLYFILNNI